ncbi:MAG: type II CAAX endopeptidase family protein [Kiritimatiellaeota bacterium]|nr:type II CAAX endopeptidase family protein [Kiritimatiellota bacterium]
MTTDVSNLGSAKPAPSNGWRVAATLLALFALLVVLSAITSVALVRYVLPHLSPAWAEVLTHRGVGKIMTRAMQVWLIVLLPLVLRFSGWRGWRDCGWRSDLAPVRPVWKDLLAGLVLGVLTLGSLALFMYLTGRRVACALDPATIIPLTIAGYALSATVVSVFEETIARGIFFRIWARVWGVVVAALFSSILFALAHFLGPDETAFKLPGFWSAVGSLCVSVLRPDTSDTAFYIRLLNLTLLGLALCAMVRLTGTIWLAVGAHAGWVWSIKLNNFFTDAVPLPLRSRIWGARGDLTDSVVGSATLLAVLLVVLWLIWRRERRGTTG